MLRKLYNQRDWILGRCVSCGQTNYVEPHGTTAQCACSDSWTEHESIPYSARIGFCLLTVDTKLLPKHV